MIGEIIHFIITFCFLLFSCFYISDDYTQSKIHNERFDYQKLIVCIFFNIVLIGAFCTQFLPTEEFDRSFPIVSLERGNQISGNFVLGFGSIDNQMVYYAYQLLAEGKYKLRTLSGNAIIIETNDVSPRYRIYAECWKDWIFYDCEMNRKKEIYVPVGTIRREFNI